MKKVIAVFLCMLLVCGSFVCAFAASESVDGCNWMSVIKDDASLADISMPGTHDTAAAYVAFGVKARCQDKTIPEQLNCGARFLDIRLKKDGEKLLLVHNFITCRKGSGFGAPALYFDDAIGYCLDFLAANPRECIVMFVKKDSGTSDGFEDLMLSYIGKNADRWYTENRVPSLGEVRGKIVLMNRFSEENTALNDQNGGINLSNFPKQNDNEGSFQIVNLNTFGSGARSTYTVQDRFNYPKADKWEKAIVPTLKLTRASGELLICFFSTANGISPEINADYINEKVLAYDFDTAKSYGAVLFDFIDAKLAAKIYACNASLRDSTLSPAKSAPIDEPAPVHGGVKFADWLWTWLIDVFS